MAKLISQKRKVTYPEKVRDELYGIVSMMSKQENDSAYFLYVYHVLKAVYDLLQRYETTCRETILIAGLEENESEMREKIIKLQKQTLYDELAVLGLCPENIDV